MRSSDINYVINEHEDEELFGPYMQYHPSEQNHLALVMCSTSWHEDEDEFSLYAIPS